MKTDAPAPKTLLTPLDHLLTCHPHFVIVGSGPAGVAVAEYLYNVFPDATIAILERGDTLMLTHINNVFTDADRRQDFIFAHGKFEWGGYFKKGGLMMVALGGRGIVAGGHLPRFDKDDFDLWDNGRWPITPSQLDRFFTVAEIVRHVSPGECESRAQTWVMGQLHEFKPHPPPWGVDVRATGARRGLDSSVQRLWELINDDYLKAYKKKRKRRLLVSTNTQVTEIKLKGNRVGKLICKNFGKSKEVETAGSMVILAASPVESARLVLASELDTKLELKAAGRYLAEHILCRTEVTVPFPIHDPNEARVNVVIPPLSPGIDHDIHQRFQIDIRQSLKPVKNGKLHLRISGFAAMDPNPKNQVVLADGNVNTILNRSTADKFRVEVMKKKMVELAERLGARKIPPPKPAYGRSNHEVGTLRMGETKSDSVTNAMGQVHDMENLFVADASVFPCVGIANPMLTITALAYRLAQHIGRKMKLNEDPKEPWNLC